MNKLSIWRADKLLCEKAGESDVQLYYRGRYKPEDEIRVACDTPYIELQVDQAMMPARLYVPSGEMVYRLPLSGDGPDAYPPAAFAKSQHVLSLRPDPRRGYRNLALNPADQRGESRAYPHIWANVETRDESVFAARNVIDGLRIANGHGKWPYQSWGIGARTDAFITLDFGREVLADEMVLYLRADFPHDAWWVEATVVLSDGASLTFPLEGLEGPQRVALGGTHRVSWIRLERLLKCDKPSAYPSLRQWEVWGQDAVQAQEA